MAGNDTVRSATPTSVDVPALARPGGHYSHACIAHWPAFNLIYERWAGAARPARAVVPTEPLHFGLKVEVEATAMV